jgi:ABC-type sugar transport system permease subunit
VNRIFLLFGQRARLISLIAWSSIILALLGALVPLLFIIYSSFFEVDSVKSIAELIGIISDSRHLQAITNSLIIALIASVFLTITSALAALTFKWCNLTGNKLIYSLSIVPLLIPDQVFGIAGRALLDPSIGILSKWMPEDLIINRNSALLVVSIFVVLKWLPAMIVLADVSIYTIEQETLFQTQMDFRSFKKAAWYVYLPEMKEVLFIIGSIGFLIGFRQHELAYELTSSGGGFTAETWSFWNYREMFEFAKIPNAAIEAFFILLLLLIPILIIRKQAQNLG